MKRILFLLTLFFVTINLFGQDARLAQQYFQDGEYEKAATLYDKLYKSNERSTFYFDRYIECLLALDEFEDCEKAIKKQLKKDPKNVNLYVTYGKLFERQIKDKEAAEQFRNAIDNLPKDQNMITRLANAFIGLTKYEFAIETYEKGAKLLKNEFAFAYNLGDLYRRKGDTPKMIEQYLNSLEAAPGRLNSLKTTFQRFLFPEDYQELQTQLYARIQDNENAIYYPEMLTWVFIQRKDYKNAFRQVKALDRRLDENGGRVYRLAEIASHAKDYDSAIEAYEYIVDQKGKASPFYLEAKQEALRAKRNKLVDGFDYSNDQLVALEEEYELFLSEFGKNSETAGIILEMSELEAFYLNDLDKAIALLSEMTIYPGVDKRVQAYGKLSLADFYLMKGDRWEATLLYSQVDKVYKDDILGHDARFRNAKLSYYMGDFEWAQTQFDVLKASTSKLIANDALDLSVFIMDNLGLDTSATALEMYAQSDLLVFQNRFEEAFGKLDSLLTLFPEHSLQDDVLYLKSKVYYKKREYQKTMEALQKIVDNYSDGIRADNALFELAGLYENHFNDQEKAMAIYETIFIDYSDSTFAVEARKKYRILRGDNVQ